jgi:hypothetical protein
MQLGHGGMRLGRARSAGAQGRWLDRWEGPSRKMLMKIEND